MKLRDGAPVCEYATDSTVFFPLSQAPAVSRVPVFQGKSAIPSVEQLGDEDKANYLRLQTDFARDKGVAIAGLDRTKLIQDAFLQLQQAENARDTAPDAYQISRANYYRLLKGQSWVDEESSRVATAEVNPKIDGYVSRFRELTAQLNSQQQLLDVAQGVKDKVVSLRDDFRYSVNTFGKQIRELQDQINLERNRRAEQTATSSTAWLDWILNALMVIVLVIAIGVLVHRIASTTSTAYTTPAFPTQ